MLLVSVLVSSVILLNSVATEEADICRCIKPADYEGEENPCPNEDECKPLMYYARGSQSNFTDNTVFKFLPGSHVLNGVYISVSRKDNLMLAGSNDDFQFKPTATVQCIGNGTGFFFEKITNLTIKGLGFRDCGFQHHYTQAVLMEFVTNLQLTNVEIHNASGYGLYGYEVVGNSSINNTVIDFSHNMTGYSAGNLRILYDYEEESMKQQSSYLVVANSQLRNGKSTYISSDTNCYASGLDIFLATSNRIFITLMNVTMTGNKARSGGNLAITYIHLYQSNTWLSSVKIQKCTLADGSAYLGGGMYISLVAKQKNNNWLHNSTNPFVVVNIVNTRIENNTADVVGAGVYIQLYEDKALSSVAHINMSNSSFHNNSVSYLTNGRGGAAINILNFQIPGYMRHKLPQYVFSLVSCNFSFNSIKTFSNDSVGSGAFFVEENAVTIVRDSVFTHNNCTGIVAIRSNLKLEGEITIFSNTGNNGGGMVLCDNSVMYLSSNVTVNISKNHASSFGSGIYAEFDCTQAIPPCFFQLQDPQVEVNTTVAAVYLDDNLADRAGSALYGGSVDYCYFFGHSSMENSTKVFQHLFNITASTSDPSAITSNPLRVCFCIADMQGATLPDCSEHEVQYDMYPGGQLTVRLVVVGQRNGPVPGVVVASLDGTHDYTLEDSQKNTEYQ